MTYLTTIKDVEALKMQLTKRRVDLNAYWHLTAGMKIAIAEDGKDVKGTVAQLMRGLKNIQSIL